MKLIQGVGINDLPRGSCSERVGGKIVVHDFYNKWSWMLLRCYDKKLHAKRPTYIGCSVCDSWMYLSNFKMWFDMQPMERHKWDLDKDILFPGMKVYSPSSCILVPGWLNRFVTESDSSRGNLPIGVTQPYGTGKYIAQVNTTFLPGRKKHIGCFSTAEEAHEAWRNEKLSIVEEIRSSLDEIDCRLYPALVQKYKSYV